MELLPPRRKYKKEILDNFLLPIGNKKFIGYFNGFSIVVPNSEDAREIISNGSFGKPQFSRNIPNESDVEILRERQYLNRNKYPIDKNNKLKKIVIVPDSDDEDYFTNLKPSFGIDKSIYKNSLILSLVEAYFLNVELKCLEIPNINNIWKEFIEVDGNFIVNYAVYLHFRAKNWVVKSGVKFGGDFLLYKKGPGYYHASYVVIIDVIDENFKRIQRQRSMEYKNLVGLNRLCETTGKELLICQVIYPENAKINSSECISKLSVNEVLFRRFVLSQN